MVHEWHKLLSDESSTINLGTLNSPERAVITILLHILNSALYLHFRKLKPTLVKLPPQYSTQCFRATCSSTPLLILWSSFLPFHFLAPLHDDETQIVLTSELKVVRQFMSVHWTQLLLSRQRVSKHSLHYSPLLTYVKFSSLPRSQYSRRMKWQYLSPN